MLRDILSVSLAMTACAALMPIKANAATLTATPLGEIAAKTDDLIDFSFTFTPTPSTTAFIRGISLNTDANELSEALGGLPPVRGILTSVPITFTSRHTVLTPVKDAIGNLPDLGVTVSFDEYRSLGNQVITVPNLSVSASAGDIVPVPEPLTIFGAATALGYGAILKRKSSKKTVS